MNRMLSRSAQALAVLAGVAGLCFSTATSADTAPPPGHNPAACQSWASSQAAAVYTSVYRQAGASCSQSGGSNCAQAAEAAARQAQTQAYSYYYNVCMTY